MILKPFRGVVVVDVLPEESEPKYYTRRYEKTTLRVPQDFPSSSHAILTAIYNEEQKEFIPVDSTRFEIKRLPKKGNYAYMPSETFEFLCETYLGVEREEEDVPLYFSGIFQLPEEIWYYEKENRNLPLKTLNLDKIILLSIPTLENV